MSGEFAARAPLLVLEAARIDGANGTLFDGVTFTLHGTRTGLLGAFHALFRLMAHELPLVSGRALLLGCPLDEAVSRGLLGVALEDGALPRSWSARDYLRTSAELSGLDPKPARRAADEVLRLLGLELLRDRATGSLSRAERRALYVAHARLGDPACIALENPLSGLDERSAQSIAELIARAADGRALLLSSPGLPPTGFERSTFEGLECVAVAGVGSDVRTLKLAPEAGAGPELVLSVTRRASELAAALTARGCQVTAVGVGSELPGLARSAVQGGAARLRVQLGGSTTRKDIIDAALEIEAPIVELVVPAPAV